MEGVQEAGDRLHAALYGKNKEDISLDIAMNNNLSRRLAIAQYYSAAYENSLYDDLKSKISGDFGNAISLMFLSPLDFCTKMLIKALKSFTTDDVCIFEMLTSKTPDEVKLIQEAYKQQANKDLMKELDKKYTGVLKKNLFNLMTIPRNINPKPDQNECQKCANTLIEQGESKWVGDENVFREIFVKKSPEELILIARYYLRSTNVNLIDVVEKKITGKNKTLIKEVLYNNIMPHELFAEKIHDAIKGLGTNEDLLTRALVSRSELDMNAVREIYLWKYNASMREDIIGDTSSYYQKICLYLSER